MVNNSLAGAVSYAKWLDVPIDKDQGYLQWLLIEWHLHPCRLAKRHDVQIDQMSGTDRNGPALGSVRTLKESIVTSSTHHGSRARSRSATNGLMIAEVLKNRGSAQAE